ncbi:hypothetical protein QG37_05720 [Candidozyma auris]|nr:hypothetical protein QG37_05720 [[Candida] auris]
MDFEANALKWAAFSGIEIETTKRISGDEKLRVRANQKQATSSPTTGQLGPAKKAIVQIWPRGSQINEHFNLAALDYQQF